MNQEDLTSVEREALERLRANAPDAPEALASLSYTSRGRVIEVLMDGGTEAETDQTVAAATHQPSDAPKSTRPPTFVDRVWAPTVAVGDKKVPIIPSSVGVVLVIVALVLVMRACMDASSPAWCEKLDDAIDAGWSEYRWNNASLNDVNYRAHSEVTGGELELTDEELDEFEEALDDARDAGRRYDDREGVRAWEESLRDAC